MHVARWQAAARIGGPIAEAELGRASAAFTKGNNNTFIAYTTAQSGNPALVEAAREAQELNSPYPEQAYPLSGDVGRGRAVRTYFFASESNLGKIHQTIQWQKGDLTCSCAGWCKRISGGVRTCKHVRLVEAGLGLANAMQVLEHVVGKPSISMKGEVDKPERPSRAFKFE